MKRTAAAAAAVVALLSAAGYAADRQGSFQLLYGQYSVNDARFEKIYAKRGPVAGVALTASLFLNLEFYLEAKFLSHTGKLTYTQEKTSFYLIPFSFGLRYVAPLGIIEPFVGAGLDYFVYYETNTIGTAVDYTRGEHAMAGIRLNFGKGVPISLSGRVKYTLAKATRNERTIDLGGLELAGGVAFVW
jgi:outer membrane protein W